MRETLERHELWAVQTPQVFRRAALERALDVPDEVLAQATDDAWLIERAGGRVGVVESSRENLKVTTPHDLVRRGDAAGRRARTRSAVLESRRDAHRLPRPPAPRRARHDRRAVLHARERRALPGRRERARDRRAGGLRARLPLRTGARRLEAPVLAGERARGPRRLLRVRARADRPAAGDRGGLRARRRGSHGQPAARRATSTT